MPAAKPLTHIMHPKDLPEDLRNLPQPVSSLFVQSNNWKELMHRPRVAIIGSRKVTAYGRQVTQQVAATLAKQGVVVISGLALGVDSLAHQAALQAGGLTMAVLPGSLDQIYPAAHNNLAMEIYQKKGALISEYPPGNRPQKWMFIERNRLVAAFSQAVIVTEAAQKSGTLHTAEFALEQGKDVFAIPGNITSPLSAGTNNLIAQGAHLLQKGEDVLELLNIKPQQMPLPYGETPQEQAVLAILQTGQHTTAMIQAKTKLSVPMLNQTLSILEIKGHIMQVTQGQWGLS